ncbi:MAG: arsenite methyltransferase [Chloroflexota bacterium]
MHQNKDGNTQQVSERYGAYAKQVTDLGTSLPFNTDGCAPQTDQVVDTLAERLYSDKDLSDLPTSVTDASLGCGNPVAIAGLILGERVLDLGSGGGIDCFMASKAVGENGYVIGVDATPDMIALANKNKEKMGLKNVEFRLGNIEALPVDSQSIDLIISNCVIDISPDKTAVFQEAYRVLKSGGRLAISDTVIMGEIPPKLKAKIDLWAGAVITPLIDLIDFLQYMTDAGFVDIRVESLTSYGLENFAELDAASQQLLTDGEPWQPLPPQTGLYSARIWAGKPYID